MFIKLTTSVICISAVLHGTIVALNAQFHSPRIALASRGASTWWESLPKTLRVGCRLVPAWTACAGADRHGLLPPWTYGDSRICTQCCKLVDRYHHFLTHTSGNALYLCIRKFCSAADEKICSVNLDHEITFLTLNPTQPNLT